MDVNETLRRLRALATKAIEEEGATWAELFAALDGWIGTGGFLPSEWAVPPATARTVESDLAEDR